MLALVLVLALAQELGLESSELEPARGLQRAMPAPALAAPPPKSFSWLTVSCLSHQKGAETQHCASVRVAILTTVCAGACKSSRQLRCADRRRLAIGPHHRGSDSCEVCMVPAQQQRIGGVRGRRNHPQNLLQLESV